MAQKKSGRAAANKKGNTNGKTAAKSMGRRQITAIVLFMLAVLMLFILFIKGTNVWAFMHSAMYGLFGLLSILAPILLGYLAVMLALDRSDKSFARIVIMPCGLLLFLCTTFDIFSNSVDNMSFFSYVGNAYVKSTSIFGGGFFGALLGYPMSYLFGSVGAKIIAILFVLVFIMLVTRTTLVSVYDKVSKPVKNMRDRYEQRAAQRELERENEENEPINDIEDYDNIPLINSKGSKKRRKSKDGNVGGAKFNIDVPLGDSPTNGDDMSQSSEDGGVAVFNPKRDELINQYSGESAAAVGNAADINAGDTAASVNAANAVEKLQNDDKVKEQNSDDKPKKRKSRTPAQSVDDLSAIGITVEVDADYKFPPIDLLNVAKAEDSSKISAETQSKSELLVNTLKSFGVQTRLVGISRGPSVTRYELQPAAGVKISKITNLSNDIALNLASAGVRIEAPIPNKAAVGIEVPNKIRSTVGIRELLQSPVYINAKSKLCCVLGKDISGEIVTMDLAKMPHLLVAGTTGSGKSVCLNSMIMSILYKASPDEVKLIMIDPKSVEFTDYNGIPHLLVPVVTNPQKAAGALGWAVNEMLKRYQIFAAHSVRNISGYNELCKTDDNLDPMPQIVIFIDELSDLMMAAPNEVEDSICRLAQMARAAGMHMVIATQSPRVDVITGLIKANIPSRIALTVSNAMDSRVIIDSAGAEKLIGSGDMLYQPIGLNKPLRVQGCWISDEEVSAVTSFLKSAGDESDYDPDIISEMEKQAAAAAEKSKNKDASSDDEPTAKLDDRINEAVELICRTGRASTSQLQSKLGLGYARAARIMDQLEENGVIGPFEGSKPRKVLMTYNQWLEKINGASVQETLPQTDNVQDAADFDDDYDDEIDDDEPPFDIE